MYMYIYTTLHPWLRPRMPTPVHRRPEAHHFEPPTSLTLRYQCLINKSLLYPACPSCAQPCSGGGCVPSGPIRSGGARPRRWSTTGAPSTTSDR